MLIRLLKPHWVDFLGVWFISQVVDRIFGFGGNDTIDGGAGSDKVEGGDGNDIIFGGILTSDADTLLGGDGNDAIQGSTGDDFIDGGNGRDELSAVAGKNTMTPPCIQEWKPVVTSSPHHVIA